MSSLYAFFCGSNVHTTLNILIQDSLTAYGFFSKDTNPVAEEFQPNYSQCFILVCNDYYLIFSIDNQIFLITCSVSKVVWLGTSATIESSTLKVNDILMNLFVHKSTRSDGIIPKVLYKFLDFLYSVESWSTMILVLLQ